MKFVGTGTMERSSENSVIVENFSFYDLSN